MDEIDDGYSGLSGVGIFASSLPGCSLRIAIRQSMLTMMNSACTNPIPKTCSFDKMHAGS